MARSGAALVARNLTSRATPCASARAWSGLVARAPSCKLGPSVRARCKRPRVIPCSRGGGSRPTAVWVKGRSYTATARTTPTLPYLLDRRARGPRRWCACCRRAPVSANERGSSPRSSSEETPSEPACSTNSLTLLPPFSRDRARRRARRAPLATPRCPRRARAGHRVRAVVLARRAAVARRPLCLHEALALQPSEPGVDRALADDRETTFAQALCHLVPVRRTLLHHRQEAKIEYAGAPEKAGV